MTVKQLSIFLENKNGTLIKVLDTLSKANIQIIASTVADTKDYGIYRVLCNNPVQAYMLLKDEGINVQLTDVFAITFLWKNMGVLVFRTDNNEKAQETIIINKLRFLTEINF